MYDIAEFDNKADIVYILNNTLPKLKQAKLKDKYNGAIELVKSKCYTNLDENKLLLCDSIILRCVDSLHLGEVYNNKISKSIVRNTTYNKEKICYSCTFTRKCLGSGKIVYSAEEKLMIYVFVSTYLKRIEGKKILLEDNLTYIDLKDIHFMFGNNAMLKSNQSEKYINIINTLVNDDIEIYIGNDKYDNGSVDRFTNWFSYIKEVYDYYGNIIGYVYSFGDLGRRFFSSTNYPTRYISYSCLSINNRNYRQFEIARYLIYKATDRKKKIDFVTIMKELYDYNNNKLYLEALYELSNPYNIKYLKTLLKSIVLVIDNLSEQFNFKLYFSEKYIDIKNIDLFANMKDYNKLYITISHRTK